MSEALNDEVTSINSIYGDDTLALLPDQSQTYALKLPDQSAVTLRIEFDVDYPDTPPCILGTQHVGDEIAKGEGNTIVELVRTVLSEVYIPGTPCIFDLIEESRQRFPQLHVHPSAKDEERQSAAEEEASGQDAADARNSRHSNDHHQPQDDLDEPPPWTLSDIITEKKSVFIARAAPVSSVEEAKSYLAHLLATDKKAAKATHNITGWRIRRADGVRFQDCDDDGEDAAGGRLLHLLELMNVWGAMVVVSRWYGGVKLGPDRFRIINQCAREAVVNGGFAGEEKESAKRKGKR